MSAPGDATASEALVWAVSASEDGVKVKNMNWYPVTSTVRLAAAFTLAGDNSAADPTAVTLAVTLPDGTMLEHTSGDDVVRDGAGAYHLDLAIDQAGTWRYRWSGTGDVVAATPVLAFGAG